MFPLPLLLMCLRCCLDKEPMEEVLMEHQWNLDMGWSREDWNWDMGRSWDCREGWIQEDRGGLNWDHHHHQRKGDRKDPLDQTQDRVLTQQGKVIRL